MNKTITSLEIKVGERLYQMLVQQDAPLGELHDVLYQMKAYVLELMNKADAPKDESKLEDMTLPVED